MYLTQTGNRWLPAVGLIVLTHLACFTLVQCGQRPMPPYALPDDSTDEPVATESAQDRARINAMGFEEPNYTPDEEKAVLALYAHLDPGKVVPQDLLYKTVLYFNKNKSRLANTASIGVVDFTPSAKYARMFVINMENGAVRMYHVAHGSGSDPDNDGFATKFSNTSGSKMSSLGFYLTGETYYGSHDLSRRLDGLSATNSKVRARAIVIHGSDYVQDSNVKPGRSWGCFALSWAGRDYVVKTLSEGSLIYAGLSTGKNN